MGGAPRVRVQLSEPKPSQAERSANFSTCPDVLYGADASDSMSCRSIGVMTLSTSSWLI